MYPFSCLVTFKAACLVCCNWSVMTNDIHLYCPEPVHLQGRRTEWPENLEVAWEHMVWGLPQGLDLACAPGMFVSYPYIHPSCAQSCLTLCDPMDHSPPGSSVHGSLQARMLDWVAISSSRGSSWPRDRAHVSCLGRRILYHWTIWIKRRNPWKPQFKSKSRGFPGGPVVKNLPCNTRDTGSITGPGRSHMPRSK